MERATVAIVGRTTTTNSTSGAVTNSNSAGLATARSPTTTITTTTSTSSKRHRSAASRSPAVASSKSATSSFPPTSPKIVYGPGTISRLPAELELLSVSSPLIVSSPSRVSLARRIQSLIPSLDSRILDSSVLNVPARVVDDVVARISGRDAVISVGGGSAVGLARAIGIQKGIPHICIPTTYSGSEMTGLVGEGSPDPATGSHIAHRDLNVLPTVVIYDEDLTKSTPRRFSVPSSTGPAAAPIESDTPRSNDDNAQWSYIHLPGV